MSVPKTQLRKKLDNQCYDINELKLENLRFGDPDQFEFNGAPYWRLPMTIMNTDKKDADGNPLPTTEGGVFVEFPEMLSFGISKFSDPNKKIKKDDNDDDGGLSVSYCLWDKDGATPEQLAAEEKLAAIITLQRDAAAAAIANKKAKVDPLIRQGLLDGMVTKKINRKRDDDGKILDESKGPILNTSLKSLTNSVLLTCLTKKAIVDC